jgi:glyoxylase-like metal-dependent hydrolase (beta-lactamase superfamily II)
MFVKQFRVGGDRNFGYLAADDVTKQAVVIDPAYNPDMIIDFAEENNYQIRYIFNTHSHWDHSNGNSVAEKRTGVKAVGFGDKEKTVGTRVADNIVFPLGETEIQIIHTPGHTEDCICILIGDALFTGDTLFVGKVGGTDFGNQAKQEYESLHNKLMKLPDTTRVFPGHDYGTSPESTINKEKETNPFLLQPDLNSFVHLKMNWVAYKNEHGIA